MTTIADRSRVPAGVTTGGQFATEARGEADVDLADIPRQDLPCLEDSLAALAEQWEQMGFAPEAAAGQARLDLEEARRLVGDGVPDEYIASLLASHRAARRPNDFRSGPLAPSGWRSRQSADAIRDAYASGMPADWPEQMAERGDEWRDGCVARWNAGVTADELERLALMGMDGHPGIAAAYAGRDLLEVRKWVEAAAADKGFSSYLARHLSHAGVGKYIGEGVPLEHVRLCCDLSSPANTVEPGLALRGLTRPDGTVEKGPDAIRELVAYAEACGRSTDEAHDGIRLGVAAADVKAFGPKVQIDEISDFKAHGIDPKVARSLRARSGTLAPESVKALADAGVVTGADYARWRKATEGAAHGRGPYRDQIDQAGWIARLASAGVPAQTVEEMLGRGVPTPSILELHDAGISDIGLWSATLHARTQQTMTSDDRIPRALSEVSRFAKAGGSPEQFRRTQRAGIPIHEAHQHVASTPEQMWQAGASGRAAVLADEKRRREAWGHLDGTAPLAGWDVAGPEDL